MEVCPKCRKPVEAKDQLILAKSKPISHIQCPCGYEGLPIEVEPKDSKRD